ncbi:hypothetical protein ACOV1W_08590 [Paraclostridium bifermentans]|uniref:Transposase family protein n=1 Tax=Paraclostridium bifermentans TaxID=1490 RepID=A0AA44DIE9_PARBF|nr:hypothetical protein [Paraclostridium bifermentans]MBN8047899.1 hypothetical protein [Paraclostridium bifermentans]NME08265.1 transposase family protein [Paraclostridium bifermentans]
MHKKFQFNKYLAHPDRWSQFIGERYQSQIESHDIIASMSKPGNPYDNIIMKYLKIEIFDSKNIYHTRDIIISLKF